MFGHFPFWRRGPADGKRQSKGGHLLGRASMRPMVNRTYADLARHYKTAILPAKGRIIRGIKLKSRVGVQIVGRWILASD